MGDKALENAKEIAELTGRTTKEVIADILDDGVLNNSIQENTSAIDKATETAQKLQKLLTAIIPILVLLAGSGLELGGIIDLTPAGEGDDDWAWEDDYEYPEPVRYGCTDYDALNYDEYAEEDDGTCEYDEPEPEPEPEVECEPFFYLIEIVAHFACKSPILSSIEDNFSKICCCGVFILLASTQDT